MLLDRKDEWLAARLQNLGYSNWFRQCGLFTASGVVEASCKTVIGQRLKKSGMHWPVAGAIAALRRQQASRPEDPI